MVWILNTEMQLNNFFKTGSKGWPQGPTTPAATLPSQQIR
jgi:hypothetical protein